MKLLLVWFLGVLEVPFTRAEQPRWRAGHSYPSPLPQELMVDAVNYIGLVLLHAHNQNNENNIALSPYGATSVLVALGEGVQGTALDEILRATLLPLDVSVTRVGLRDIHRHLKSYFIPQEGFLAGLTFSHENVTLKPSYEDILRFYGYDVDSFNNALYPDPYSSTTTLGSESTTESLSSVSYGANFSSSTTTETVQTIPTTVAVPTTIENRDEFNNSESTTRQTTQMLTSPTPVTSEAVPESTTATTTRQPTQMLTNPTTVANEAVPESSTATATRQTTQMLTSLTTVPSEAVTESAAATTTTTTRQTTQMLTSPTTVPSETVTESAAATTTRQTTQMLTSPTIVESEAIPETTPTTTVTTTRPTTTVTLTPQASTVTTTAPVIADTTTTQVTTTISPESTATTVTPSSTAGISSTQPTTSSSIATAGVTTTSSTTTSSATISSSQTTSALDSTTQTPTVISNTTLSTSVPTTSPVSTTTANKGTTSIPTPGATNAATTTSDNVATTTVIALTSTITQSTRPTSLTISVVPSTIGNGNSGSTTAGSTTTAIPLTQILSTGPLIINLQPTTIATTSAASSVTDSTSAITESISTITTASSTDATSTDSTDKTDIPSTTIISSTSNTQSTTLNSNSSPIAISTVGTGNTGSTPSSSTTENPDVSPSTVAPNSAGIVMAESLESGKSRRMVTNNAPKKNSLPRFRDDVDLIKSLNSENKSATVQRMSDRSFVSEPSASKNSFGGEKKPTVESTTLFKTMKDFTIDATIGKTTANSPIEENQASDASASDFITSTADYSDDSTNGAFTAESGENYSSTMQMDSQTSETEIVDEDEDVIIVNRETDTVEGDESSYVESEMVLSEEDMFSTPSSFEKRSVSTEGNGNEGKTRGTRSVVDYLIARYHDSNPPNAHVPSAGEYEPAKPTTFSVNGKIREPNISFMTYDAVLPFRYISYLNALALTFPLDSTKYYLLLILPLDEMGIDNLISNMMSTTLKQIIYHLQPTRVKATIPSFMLKGYVVLTPTLQKLGIRQIFEPRHADFSRMTDDKDIYVTNIEQAVTVTIRNYVDPSTLQNNQHFRRRGPVQFTADHPFLYFVMDSQIHVALMAGKIINPLNSRIR